MIRPKKYYMKQLSMLSMAIIMALCLSQCSKKGQEVTPEVKPEEPVIVVTAVMFDKMNVFYIGVDNPITISSSKGWDKTKVSMTGGSLVSAGSAGKYRVKATAPGNASITVNADGKISTYDFVVRNVPNPILVVGPSEGGRLQSVVFKNQQFAKVELKDFHYDYQYSIVSATVYFTGANFPTTKSASISSGSLSALQALMTKVIPGTTVVFDNVRVQGPGGPVKSIPGAGFLLY